MTNLIDSLKPNVKNILVTLVIVILFLLSLFLVGKTYKIIFLILIAIGVYVGYSFMMEKKKENYHLDTLVKKMKKKDNPLEFSESSLPSLPSAPSTCNASEEGADSCSSCTCGTKPGEKLSPILDPRFNLREVAKHMILLEDHLFHKEKRCKQCCLKHMMTIEAFLDEAVTLDKDGEYHTIIVSVYQKFVKVSRKIHAMIRTGDMDDQNCCDLAQEVRTLRKPCMIEGSKIDI